MPKAGPCESQRLSLAQHGYAASLMVAQLWTQRFTARWRSELSYYERRLDIMRQLKDAGLLTTFRVSEERMSARLGDASHLVVFSHDMLTVSALQPFADLDRLRSACGIVIDMIQPSALRRIELSGQWLAPLTDDYDVARARATRAVANLPDEVEPRDTAVLLDIDIQDPQSTVHAEFGVLQAREMPMRLARVIGRMPSPQQETPASLWTPESLPPVAAFCDATVRPDATAVEASLDAFVDLWDGLVLATGKLVESILSPLYSEQEPESE